MIEIGIVTSHKDGKIVVKFEHLGTLAECDVLQTTTGDNTIFILPTINTQVVCWIENGKNIALGALFSRAEPPPKEKSDLLVKCGDMQCTIVNNKMQLKNSSSDFKTILNDILNVIKNITVSTPTGTSGTPLPPTIISIEQCSTKINNLLK
ncbi:MAG: hypothetical protein RR277_04995 [Rikenellaceae bacterium]